MCNTGLAMWCWRPIRKKLFSAADWLGDGPPLVWSIAHPLTSWQEQQSLRNLQVFGHRQKGWTAKWSICRSCWTGNNLWELHWFLLLRHAIDLQDLQFKYFCRSSGVHGIQSFCRHWEQVAHLAEYDKGSSSILVCGQGLLKKHHCFPFIW